MKTFYFISPLTIHDISQKVGMSLGVLVDVLQSCGDEVEAYGLEEAMMIWWKEKLENPLLVELEYISGIGFEVYQINPTLKRHCRLVIKHNGENFTLGMDNNENNI